MRELFKIELEKVSGGLMERPRHPGDGGLRNATNPLNKTGKPKGWAGAIVIPPPDERWPFPHKMRCGPVEPGPHFVSVSFVDYAKARPLSQLLESSDAAAAKAIAGILGTPRER